MHVYILLKRLGLFCGTCCGRCRGSRGHCSNPEELIITNKQTSIYDRLILQWEFRGYEKSPNSPWHWKYRTEIVVDPTLCIALHKNLHRHFRMTSSSENETEQNVRKFCGQKLDILLLCSKKIFIVDIISRLFY